ncbi:shikimate kinase [bacterium]|nr:shikimate kinase [bacterium]
MTLLKSSGWMNLKVCIFAGAEVHRAARIATEAIAVNPVEKTPMPGKYPVNIVLVGMPGSGKTTVGFQLSKLMKKRFVDMDRMLVKQFKMPITQVFAAVGEDVFRDAETALCEQMLSYRNVVVSTGGGVVGRPINRTLLRSIGKVIYLAPDIGILLDRLSNDKSRPLLKTTDPKATLRQLYSDRDPLYRDCAHEVISISGQSPRQVAESILDRIRRP